MKNTHWVILFFAALIGDLVGIQLKNETLVFICKPLIIVTLAAYFISATTGSPTKLKKWILLALVFSWIGDVFLLFDDKRETFFLLGLSSFLLAHVFYIFFFHQVRQMEKIKSRGWILVPVVLYYLALTTLLSPYLGDKKIPVYVYGIVISSMLLLAVHMLYSKNRIAGRWIFTGALLFIISDSLLAINKFYHPLAYAGQLVMLTYGIAQLCIVYGAIHYIGQSQKK